MITNIGTVLEAAEIRANQWQLISEGRDVMNDDIVDELFECQDTVEGQLEAGSIAEEQKEGIKAVRDSLPPRGENFLPDALANAAMCIWEEVLMSRKAGRRHLHRWISDGEGAASARDGCYRLAGYAEFVYNGLGGAAFDFDAYDWDFIPTFIYTLFEIASDRGIGIDEVDDVLANEVLFTMVQRLQEED